MCTLEKRGGVFILTLTGDGEHRLNPSLIDSIRAALARVRSESSGSSSALITKATGKFFSNGLDLDWARRNTDHTTTFADRLRQISIKFRSLVRDLISLPLPTIAAVTGHAVAGGLVLVLCHDYVLMRKDRGLLYMSELDIGFKVPAWLGVLMKCKLGSGIGPRAVVMKAVKLTAVAAANMGIVDSVHGNAEETVDAGVELGKELVRRRWDGVVYGEIRCVLFADLLSAIEIELSAEDAITVVSKL
ncbi:enoyl-CoA delta isomerase 1, peroxisomal-like [Impatiens glandulifera]|uniref:enoyl-CoA delta isomerase 1, peroxisomal-like n=1 Tax=Impatiens glandulifera TaxID=253017 RepID=UPI001FB055EA|nr:enoyl-CoA delta isomerase 1, peroxisomal-like [Impatiens glandulifera]